MVRAQRISSTHAVIDAAKMVIIDECRDEVTENPGTLLKVGTSNVEAEDEWARMINVTTEPKGPAVQLDDATKRTKVDSLVADLMFVSEVMVAVRKLVISVERSNVPTVRARSISDRCDTPKALPEKPSTAVSSTCKT